ncbi:MAG: sugar phosphate permease [Myxococcales bacterium]|nr:sugar phosphate permease [Myxococcales bacterium]
MSATSIDSGGAALTPLDRARRKAYARLIPLVFVCYAIAYIDRANVAFAKLTMQTDLGFDDAIFGTGFGIFFLGYVLLEVPGALLVERWSARKWMSRIMISWGIVAGCTALVKTPHQFYFMRFLLGLSEAGFFPGAIVYLTHWFPARDRARALALLVIAAPIAQMVSVRVSVPILRIDTTEIVNHIKVTTPPVFGLHGWQIMYVVWAVPAVVLGLVVLFKLTDRPAQARWLTDDERDALEAELARERSVTTLGVAQPMSLGKALLNPAVLLLALANFLITSAHYGIEAFQPTIFKTWFDLNISKVAWATFPSFGAILVGMLTVSWSSDRRGERWFHTFVPIFWGAAVLLLTMLGRANYALTIVLFAVALFGLRSYVAPFYALPKLFLEGTAAAGAIGFINAVANLGGFAGPWMLGKLSKATGSFVIGFGYLSATAAAAGVCIVALRVYYNRRRTASR